MDVILKYCLCEDVDSLALSGSKDSLNDDTRSRGGDRPFSPVGMPSDVSV
jgi:hypothetical protein